jgi:hypothetical protein
MLMPQNIIAIPEDSLNVIENHIAICVLKDGTTVYAETEEEIQELIKQGLLEDQTKRTI